MYDNFGKSSRYHYYRGMIKQIWNDELHMDVDEFSEKVYTLTNREKARLQTFPDDYYFCGSKESVRKQIGMAVPPAGAQIIFEAILKTFASIPYE